VSPIEMAFDPKKQRLRTTSSGMLSLSDLLAHLDDEERQGNLGVSELFDARASTTDLTANQVRELVDRMSRHAREGGLGPTALVTQNDLVFGMARMYSILSEDFDPRFRVCRDIESAERWLDAGAPPESGSGR